MMQPVPQVPMHTDYRSSGRIHELDALRGIAALGVVFWHYGVHFDAHPWRLLLHPFYNAGFLLVDFFFVLSGYVIGRAYWNEKRQWHVLRNIWARVARLYPLHLLTLLVTAALVLSLPSGANDVDFKQPTNDLRHFALHLLLLNQVGVHDGWSFNTPAWSISAEFIINVAFLAFIALGPAARLAWTTVLAIAGVALFATLRPPVLHEQTAFGFLDVNLLRCALGFAAGVFVYLLVHRWGAARWLTRVPGTADVLGLGALIGMTTMMVASGRHAPIFHYLLSIAAAMGCVAFIPFGRLLKAILCRRWLVVLGDISYSTYLVHYPLQVALYALVARGVLRGAYESPVMLGAYVASVIAVATLTYHLVELPWQSRLLAIASRQRAQPA